MLWSAMYFSGGCHVQGNQVCRSLEFGAFKTGVTDVYGDTGQKATCSCWFRAASPILSST